LEIPPAVSEKRGKYGEKVYIPVSSFLLMQTQKLKVAARAAGARGGPGNRTPAEWYTIVVYERRRVSTVVLYVGRWTFTFKVPTYRKIRDLAVVVKEWRVGGTPAYSARIHAKNLVDLINAYAYEEAVRKMSLIDPIYRAAALNGYKVHDNELYVRLWLEHPLGAELFPIGDPRERELGTCIKHFTHSYGIWRMVTPPWAATC
jgi:hypothetical protein